MLNKLFISYLFVINAKKQSMFGEGENFFLTHISWLIELSRMTFQWVFSLNQMFETNRFLKISVNSKNSFYRTQNLQLELTNSNTSSN